MTDPANPNSTFAVVATVAAIGLVRLARIMSLACARGLCCGLVGVTLLVGSAQGGDARAASLRVTADKSSRVGAITDRLTLVYDGRHGRQELRIRYVSSVHRNAAERLVWLAGPAIEWTGERDFKVARWEAGEALVLGFRPEGYSDLEEWLGFFVVSAVGRPAESPRKPSSAIGTNAVRVYRNVDQSLLRGRYWVWRQQVETYCAQREAERCFRLVEAAEQECTRNGAGPKNTAFPSCVQYTLRQTAPQLLTLGDRPVAGGN